MVSSLVFGRIFGRGYPADMVKEYSEGKFNDHSAWVLDGDLEISVQTNFGINYYSRAVIRSDKVSEEENWGVGLMMSPYSLQLMHTQPWAV